MKPEENIEKLIKSLHFKASAEMHERTLNDVLDAHGESRKTEPAEVQPHLWRIVMKSKITKLTAACAIIAIAVVLAMYLERATPSAYAITQTIEANRGIKQLYFEYYAPSDSNVAKECWVEFDESGQPKNVRTNLHKYWGDQLLVHVWKEGKTQTWRKKKNTLLCYEAESFTAKILHLVSQYDPRSAVETLYERQKKGQVKIEIEEPASKGDPIKIRGTFLPGKYLLEKPNMPSFRDVLHVDRKTKLVTAIEVYELKDGADEYRGVWKYSNYDKPFDVDVFDLEDELPPDVRRIDLMALDIGLERGDLSEEEVAVRVVRQFYEALIKKDCAKAIKFIGSSYHDPDDRAKRQRELEQSLEQLSVVRIVSIGKPRTRATDAASALRVPCIIECEKDGEIIKHNEPGIAVYWLFWNPNRWAIMGKTPLP
ncbi:MAG: hypothetical protein ACYS8I_15695 [Planctomycetota bacterium]|jgi:hypothetical protein